MNQEQPWRPGDEHRRELQPGVEPIKYGDVFPVSGDLASKPIAPQDAAMMQSAQAAVLGEQQRGGPAGAMRAAAEWNEGAGLVRREDVTGIVAKEGVTVGRIVTERVAGQVVDESLEGAKAAVPGTQQSAITIGEALEAAAQVAGDKPVDRSDAAAILMAELRATGTTMANPGRLATSAETAAAYNEGTRRDDSNIKISEVLTGATLKLPADKVASREDAEQVVNAELGMGDKATAHPGVGGGVGGVDREAQREYHQSVKE